MAKKDFNNIDVNPVYANIAEATKAEEQETIAEDKAEEITKTERKTYTEEEAQEYLESLNTAGRKGVHLPRINVAFTPSNYEYIKIMAKVSGMNLTEFLNEIIKKSREDNSQLYELAINFRKNLK